MREEAPHMIASKKHAPEKLGRVLILGLGKSGKAVCEYCLGLVGARIDSLTVAAGNEDEQARLFANRLDAENVKAFFNRFDFEERYDLCIVSPGIPQISEFYQNALHASKALISEVEFAWRESDETSQWVGITGTNGKTTTTALTAHILRNAGLRVQAVGNIGTTCIEAVSSGKFDTYVVELSSYQLASTILFKPNVAVLLNISPDHIDWHGSYAAYVQAKTKIFTNSKEGCGSFVFDASDPQARKAFISYRDTVLAKKASSSESVGSMPSRDQMFEYIPLGTAEGLGCDMRKRCGSVHAAFVRDDALFLAVGDEEYRLIEREKLQVRGEHNISNVLAGSAAAFLLGADPSVITASLSSFAPLEHRIEPCGTIAGVSYFNDSKATNIDASIKAINSFEGEPLIVLLGGHDKGTELSSLVEAVEKSCKFAICFGAAGPRFFEALKKTSRPNHLSRTLEDALHKAIELAVEGDRVVLSPACASFDEFSSYEQRGTVFKALLARASEQKGA